MSEDHSVIFSVADLHRSFRKKGERVLGTAGLTIGQFRVLSALKREGGLCQRDIERECVISRSGVSGLVDALEGEGLIVRERVDSDKRLRRLSLTKGGEERLNEAEALIKELDISIEAILGEEEIKGFLGAVGRLIECLGE